MKYCLPVIFIIVYCFPVFSQLSLTVSSQENTHCNGGDCLYSGTSSVLINEVMMSPSEFDGSIYGQAFATNEGEWIELYNSDTCNPVDISCFILGNSTNDNPSGDYYEYGGGYVIPPGSIIPSGGYAIIRGIYAPPVASGLLAQNGGSTIEIVVSSSRVCVDGGIRFWLPNAGGWLALYDNNGQPLDAISWFYPDNACTDCEPCLPTGTGCNSSLVLSSYDEIPANKKNFITDQDPGLYLGQSFRRMPDGGAWQNLPDDNTCGSCNQIPCHMHNTSCNGEASVSVSGGSAPYTYLWNDIYAQNSSTATQLCSGIYSVTVTDANQITAVAWVTVNNHKPNVNLNPFPDVCEQSPSFILHTGTPAVHGTYDSGVYSGNGVLNNTFSPSSTGPGQSSIIYTYTDEYGCFNSDTSQITVNVNPVPVISGDLNICTGDTTILDAGTGYVFYHWSTSANTQAIMINTAGVYSVTVTDYNDCTGNATDTVTENSSPPVIGGSTGICSGDSAILDAGSGYVQYQWSTLENTQIINISDSGSYSVTVTNIYGCTSFSSLDVIVNPLPDAGFISNTILGCEPLTISFMPVNPIPNGIYLWDFGDGSSDSASGDIYPEHTFINSGTYDIGLSVTSPEGCVNSMLQNNMITVIKQPIASFRYTPEYPSLINPDVRFINQSVKYNTLLWDFGDGVYSSETDPLHTYGNVGDYQVYLMISESNICFDTATAIVMVDEFTFYAPNAIAPDNINENNTFYVLGYGITDKDFIMYIYDRWGEVIYETDQYSPESPSQYGWNGRTYNGKIVPVGTYTWLVIYHNKRGVKHIKAGMVNVIR